MLGYMLMDYVDEYAVTDVALFSARYNCLAQWNLGTLLPQLVGRPVTATALRAEFRALLEVCRGLTARQTALRTVPACSGSGLPQRGCSRVRRSTQ